MTDPSNLQILVAWANLLIGAISLVIASIGLRGYLRVKNWKSLFLAFAFLIISFSSLIFLPQAAGLTQWSTSLPGSGSGYGQLLTIFKTIFQSIAFILLAAIYADELRARIIELSRAQMDVLSILLAIILVTISYVGIETALHFPFGLLVLITYISSAISILMLLLIVVSLYSYWKENDDSSTLITLTGFVLISIYEIFSILSFDQPFFEWINTVTNGRAELFGAVFSLFGYAFFLLAIIRLRVRYGRG
jgi:hypothetical protein